MDIFKVIAGTNDWYVIYPEIGLGILALVILMIDVLVPKKKEGLIPGIAIGGQIIIFVGLILGPQALTGDYFGGMIRIGAFTQVIRIFFLVSSLLVSYLGILYFAKQKSLPRSEFYALVTVVTAGMMLLVESSNFVMLFIALETVTVGLLILVAYSRTSEFSLEAGLKFLILGALSSALLLFGIVLLYGVGGNPDLPAHTIDAMNFRALGYFIEANDSNLLVKMGVVLIICGLSFKIGAFPFQIWIPDVYQGAPTPVTAFLAVSSKAAGIFVLFNLVRGPFFPLEDFLIPLISAIAMVSILFANVAALSQNNLKRLMGLSGVSHAGYLLIGIVASFSVNWAILAIIFYLFTYLLGSYGVFCIMGHMSTEADEDQRMEDYQDFAKNNRLLGTGLLVGIGSLAGIPPLAGFIGKLLLFIVAFEAKLYFLLGVAIIGVVISIYYYFGWLRDAFFSIWGESKNSEDLQRKQTIVMSFPHKAILALIIIGTVLLGVYQDVFGNLFF
ncbi:MAG: NADH-quinone oxidoreductase subunit N [Verrucomicrobia bacterium]|nr:MAG: NADH-quinone oxidoreductase subunit N [Verrucomicrobiota bacterium]